MPQDLEPYDMSGLGGILQPVLLGVLLPVTPTGGAPPPPQPPIDGGGNGADGGTYEDGTYEEGVYE